jgi:hypothetical protein
VRVDPRGGLEVWHPSEEQRVDPRGDPRVGLEVWHPSEEVRVDHWGVGREVH